MLSHHSAITEQGKEKLWNVKLDVRKQIVTYCSTEDVHLDIDLHKDPE